MAENSTSKWAFSEAGRRNKDLRNRLIHEMGSRNGLPIWFSSLLLWLDDVRHQPKLERPTASMWHKLVEGVRAGRVVGGEKNLPLWGGYFDVRPQLFLVEHDWAGAICNEEIAYEEVRLPFDRCCFEWQLNGRRVIALVDEVEGVAPLHALLFVQMGDVWYAVECNECNDKDRFRFVFDSIRSISVAVEAGVAQPKLVAAPAALNKARLKRGRQPLPDFHIVSVVGRSGQTHTSTADGRKGSIRLHFRKGHWRTRLGDHHWVRWCLAGNPDLGFIDKHYRA